MAITPTFSEVSQEPEESDTNISKYQIRDEPETPYANTGPSQAKRRAHEGTDDKLRHGNALNKLRPGITAENLVKIYDKNGAVVTNEKR